MSFTPTRPYLITGVPSKNAIFGMSVILAMCEHIHGAADYRHIQNNVDLKSVLANAPDDKALVVFVEARDLEAVWTLRGAADQLVVFDDHFGPATHFFMTEHRRDFRSAVRYASACLSIMPLFDDADRALRLTPPFRGLTFGGLVNRLAEHYGVMSSADANAATAHIARRVGIDDELIDAPLIRSLEPYVQVTREPVMARLALTNHEERALSHLASVYDNLASSIAQHIAVEWPVDFLMSGDQPNTYLEPTIELCGPARLLCYGPYLHLPRGAWVLEVILEVYENLSLNEGEVSIHEEGKERGRATFQLDPLGRYQVTIPFAIESPLSPLEVYVRTNEGAIEGVLTVNAIRFVCAATDHGA